MTPRLTLSLIDGPAAFQPETRSVADYEFTIGRGRDAGWTLADPDRNELSRRHCLLTSEPDGWWIVDLSGNGTFINAETMPIGQDGRRSLRDGDRFRIGRYLFQVQLDQPREPQRPWTAAPPRTSNPFDDEPAPAPALSLDPGPVEPAPMASAPGRAGHGVFNPFDSDGLAAESPAWTAPSSPAANPFETAAAPAAPLTPGRVKSPFDDEPEPMPAPDPATAPPAAAPGGANPFDEEAPSIQSRRRPDPAPPPPPPAQVAVAETPRQPVQETPSPKPVAPPVAAPAGDDARLLAALLAGVGLPDAEPRDPEQTMRLLGAGFRAMVAGLRKVQEARRLVRGEFRIAQTRSTVNPLKVAVSDDDALEALLGGRRRAVMTPEAAIRQMLDEVVRHEMALMKAMEQAVRALLEEMSPARIREAADQDGALAILPGQRKARSWDRFEAHHARLAAALDDDFDSGFGRAFALAYERIVDEDNPP